MRQRSPVKASFQDTLAHVALELQEVFAIIVARPQMDIIHEIALAQRVNHFKIVQVYRTLHVL